MVRKINQIQKFMKKLKKILTNDWVMVLLGLSIFMFEIFWIGGE